jgi:hypothetical protein
MEMKQLCLSLDVPSVLVIKPENLGVETWAQLPPGPQMELSSALGQASLTLIALPSGQTEVRLSGVLPSTSIFLSELKKRLGIPSSSDGE